MSGGTAGEGRRAASAVVADDPAEQRRSVPPQTSDKGPGTEPDPDSAPPTGGFLAKAALVTAVLSALGSLLGLVRDQSLAKLFGAGPGTDAFLVAWTVPELAATLLIEEGMAFALVPLFSMALARRSALSGSGTVGAAADTRPGPVATRSEPATAPAAGAAQALSGAPGLPAGHHEDGAPDPVRALVRSSLPKLALCFTAAAVLLALAAPLVVRLLAPGLDDPGLAVDCTRLTASCAVSFGLAGYCSAVLRAHRSFLAPAAIYVAYNLVIIASLLVLGQRMGVRAAAFGVAAGGLCMVLVQVPALLRRLREDRPTGRTRRSGRGGGTGRADGEPQLAYVKRPFTERARDLPRQARAAVGRNGALRGSAPRLISSPLIASVLCFALMRQSQVFIERHLGAGLPAGAISHLNYAQKIAQLPMSFSLMLCTVTFPVVARALAEGDVKRARERVERDLSLTSCLVMLGAAAVFACAPQIVRLLFQHGAFTASDTAATSSVIRVYACGLLGHTLVGALVRAYFSAGRGTWYPVAAMFAGAVATAVGGLFAVGHWGVQGIAAANAAGITLTAALMLRGSTHAVPLPLGRVALGLLRPVAGATAAVFAALAVLRATADSLGPLLQLVVVLPLLTLVFLATTRLLGNREVAEVLDAAAHRLPVRRRPRAPRPEPQPGSGPDLTPARPGPADPVTGSGPTDAAGPADPALHRSNPRQRRHDAR